MNLSNPKTDALFEAEKILSKWGCTRVEKSKLLAYCDRDDTPSGKNDISSETFERALCIISIDESLVISFNNSDSVNNWVNKENSHPMFSGRCAIDLMLDGPIDNLKDVASLLAGWAAGSS